MPSYGHRALLRLRRLPTSARTIPAGAPASSRAVHSTTPSSADVALASGGPSLPPFMLRVSSGPDRAPLRASPLASSSKLTLDAFFDAGIEERSGSEALWSALSFACDDELVMACLASPPVPGTATEGSWLDPGTAYLGLRASGMFSHYLSVLLPRVRTLYANLRPSGMHQLLVSDLLLRNPDPNALRDILQEEADPSHPRVQGDKLRTGLVVQVYRAIAPSIRRRTVPRLSRPVLLAASRALRQQDALNLLPEVYYELANATTWSPDSTWPLLEIVLHLARKGRSHEALRLLHYPLALGKLPPAATVGRSDHSHPQAAALAVQSTVARAALAWGLDVRAMRAVDDLVDTMVRSEPYEPSVELVLQACRGAGVVRANPDWAGETLSRLASDPRFPPLSAADLDVHLAALPTPAALDFYTRLPEGRHEPPSPRHVLRLALARPSRGLLTRLARDLRNTSDAAAAVPGMLCAFARARLLPLARAAYAAWSPRLDAHSTLTLVRAFTRGARTATNSAFARTVLDDYLANASRTRTDASPILLTALHAHALLGSGADVEAPLVAALVARHGQDGAEARLRARAAQYPLLAHRFAQIARAHGMRVPSGAAVAAACAGRHWGALSAPGPFTPEDTVFIAALRAARQGRASSATTRFVTAANALADQPALVSTAAALLHRFAGLGAWARGMDVAIAALAATCEMRTAEDVVEHVAVFLAGMRRAKPADDAWVRIDELEAVAGTLEPASRTLLMTVIETARPARVVDSTLESVESAESVESMESTTECASTL